MLAEEMSGGDEQKDEPDVWIGCEYCFRWFHKECLADDFTSMTEDEIKAFDFKCRTCQKSKKKLKKTR